MSAPSAIAGLHHAARLNRLVVTVWLLSIAAFAPLQAVMLAMTGPVRANLPAAGLDAGEGLVVFFEILRPAVVPLAAALCCGGVVFIAWCVLWHAGCVRWWLGGDSNEVSVARVLAGGLPVWWRYARLALIMLVLQGIALVVPWLPLWADFEERLLMPMLVAGAVLAPVGFILVSLGGLRGAWLLGESGRRSALVAWGRGVWASLRQPVRSLLPLLFWAAPGLALLVLPLTLDGPWVPVALLAAWLAGAFCWVALHLSYAPPRPAPESPPAPSEKTSGTPYVTTRFPTLLRDK